MNKGVKTILTVIGIIAILGGLLIAATMYYFEPVKDTMDVSLTELSKINDQIITYFQSDNVEYHNYSYNYVDTQNKVVVVGLINNSKEEQDRFKELVIDSPYIKFEEGKPLSNY